MNLSIWLKKKSIIFFSWSIQLTLASLVSVNGILCKNLFSLLHAWDWKSWNQPYLNNFKSQKFIRFSTFCIFHVYLATYEFILFWCMWPHACKRLKRFLQNMPLTLTSEARVLNSTACGIQWHNPGIGCGGRGLPPKNIFFSRLDKFMDNFFFSKVVKLTWKMQNVLTRMKNQFFSFYFLRYDRSCT